jgi:hypothetical protein
VNANNHRESINDLADTKSSRLKNDSRFVERFIKKGRYQHEMCKKMRSGLSCTSPLFRETVADNFIIPSHAIAQLS